MTASKIYLASALIYALVMLLDDVLRQGPGFRDNPFVARLLGVATAAVLWPICIPIDIYELYMSWRRRRR